MVDFFVFDIHVVWWAFRDSLVFDSKIVCFFFIFEGNEVVIWIQRLFKYVLMLLRVLNYSLNWILRIILFKRKVFYVNVIGKQKLLCGFVCLKS